MYTVTSPEWLVLNTSAVMVKGGSPDNDVQSPKLLEWRVPENLPSALGLKNVKELQDHLSSNLFQPYWEEYAKRWVCPQRREIKGYTGTRGLNGVDHDQYFLECGGSSRFQLGACHISKVGKI